MSSIIDFSDALKGAIEYGQYVDGSTVRQIVSDNGTEIGKGVYEVVSGGNGNAQGVWKTVVATAQGFLTTGLSYLAISLPTAFAALAPCLGVAAGVKLYEITSGDEEFSDRLLEALRDEGKTLGNKILAFFNGENLYFDKATIETVKDVMIDAGVFEFGERTSDLDFGVTYPIPIGNACQVIMHDNDLGDLVYAAWGGQCVTLNRQSNRVFKIVAASGVAGAVTGSTQRVNWNGLPLDNTYTYDDKTVYYRTLTLRLGVGEFVSAVPVAQPENVDLSSSQLAWAMIYGTGTDPTTQLQPDAKYPSDEEFPLTYPEWYPLNYPDGQTEDFPEVFPAKYPEIDPNEQPNQKQAQDPDPEDPNEFPIIIPDFDIPNPNVNPDPVEDEDYDPDYDPEYDPDDDEDPTTPDPDPDENVEQDEDEKFDNPDPDVPDEPDPVDPNTGDDVITPVIPPITLPDTVSSNKLFTVYNPSMAQLNALGAYLWDSSLMETIKKIWQNPLDGVISLIQVYATPVTGGSSNIILGYLDSGVSAPVVSSQFVSVDCGSVTLAEKKKNATDYSPYTALSIYLPFIGITELDVDECMGATINVTYKIDVYTGTCLALVKITRAKDLKNGGILYTYNGNCSQQLPLTSGDATGVLSSLIGAVGSGLAIASGGGLGLVAGANLIGNSINHEMLHVSHSGNISANAGIMGDKNPYLIISRVHSYDANAYNTYYGYPANKTVYLANCNGFIKVKDVHLQTSATDIERTEIEKLLHEGIIL